MKCDKCGNAITSGDEHNHHDQTLCEDCYIIALSPIKTCDPWAVHCAKSFENMTGNTQQLTKIQAEMLEMLKTHGAMEPETLLQMLGHNMQLADLQREFSTLRHMEKVKGEKRGQQVFWRLWSK